MRFLLLFLLILSSTSFPESVEVRQVEKIIIQNGEAKLLQHESIMFGLSCKSGPIAQINDLTTLKINDEFKYQDLSFRIGLIQATTFNEDMIYNGKILGLKGQTTCAVAEDESQLPYEDDCSALWLAVQDCIVVENK